MGHGVLLVLWSVLHISLCVVQPDCWERLLDLPGHLCQGGIQWLCAAWTRRSYGRLYGACLITPLLVYLGCAWEMPQFSRETEQASSAIMCRLAGMKLDKGTLQTGKPPETEGGTRMRHVCVWDPSESARETSPHAGDQWKADCLGMDSNLVDSASSHTLVSKIKPCMSKYNHYTGKLRTAHYISYCFFDSPLLLGYL